MFDTKEITKKTTLVNDLENTGVFDKRMEEPPKRWYNWVAALVPVRAVNGINIPQWGVTYAWREPHKPPYPSKEIAEERAKSFMRDKTPDGKPVWKYLGALPEGKKPESLLPL
jgi:hypothetical protein